MPSPPLSDTGADDVEEADDVDMCDFPGIPFVVALSQHLSSVVFGCFGAYTLLGAYAKAYASLRGLRGAPT